ncbi:MAG: NADH-quinone oxidoreductase subunit J [Gemmatales bacterium]
MSKFFSWLVTYWYLVLPLVTGFLAIVTLLPHPSKGSKGKIQAGLAAGVLTMLLIGLLMMRSSGHIAVDLFFDAFAIITIASAAAVIVQCNPVYSALYFAITVLGVCGLFLIKSASFLAAATIIVYAGAIIVTFLFVIMLAQQAGLADYDRRSRERIFSCLAGFVLLASILFIIEKNFAAKDAPALVVSTLKEAQSLTAPDRYQRLRGGDSGDAASEGQVDGNGDDAAVRCAGRLAGSECQPGAGYPCLGGSQEGTTG